MNPQRLRRRDRCEDLEAVVVVAETSAKGAHLRGIGHGRFDTLRVADWVIRSLQDHYAHVHLAVGA